MWAAAKKVPQNALEFGLLNRERGKAIAVEYGFKIANPELQEQLAACEDAEEHWRREQANRNAEAENDRERHKLNHRR